MTEATGELTLAEIEQRSGVSARTIRFYTGRGMLPAPAKVGRMASYNLSHLARLQLIRELQGHGFTLSAIEVYLTRIPPDASHDDIALHRALLAPWISDLPETLSRDQLAQYAGRALSPADLETLELLGILEPTRPDSYRVSTALLSLGASLLDLGLPRRAANAAREIFAAHGQAIAEELTAVFRTEIWPVYKESRLPPDELREMVERFKPVTIAALVRAYETAVDETKRKTIARRATRSANDPAASTSPTRPRQPDGGR